ncbi:MAG: sigma-70 family RNA polymerase sigma factor, partial [Planctomycetota bacterium]
WRSAPHRAARSAEELEDAVGRERFEEERPGPAAVAEGREVGDQVAQAVADLPEALRTTFVLRFYQGLSFEEIAQAVERTEVAVRKRFSRALEQLRQDLAHLDPGGQGFLRGGKVH